MVSLNGLTTEEVNERISRGEVNLSSQNESRTYGDIIKSNVCTKFNLMLFGLGAALVILGEPLNALAATGIIIMNVLIATVQECRAKRRLDKIALLLRPKVTVVRNGEKIIIDQKEIVKDDLIYLEAGDQALVDGFLVHQDYLEMDESLLTGESRTVRKSDGDRIYSGSFCIAGDGYFQVDAFGDDSFASQMLSSAKKHVVKKTPLQMECQTIIMMLMGVAVLMSVIATVAAIILGDTLTDVVVMVAVIIEIVPVALFLLIVITYMVAAVRMADSGVLLQVSSSVESMSHVDTVCMDKTGTITTNKLKFNEAFSLSDEHFTEYVRLFVGNVGGKNRTINALEGHYGSVEAETLEEIRFSSERKFSAVKLRYEGKEYSMYMGAGSVLCKHIPDSDGILEKINDYSSRGLRTVMFAMSDGKENMLSENFTLPVLKPLALFIIEDEVRSDCRETIDVFLRNGMDLKVISGDDPVTVNALFDIAKIPGERKIISGDELERLEGQELVDTILETNIFGRVKPDQKELIIKTLRKEGRYVAMVGDGVNDVKSLKQANVGVALESGSGAARSVADMVLVKDNFAALPKALVEGKRTVSGMRDILKIYISRNFTLAIIIALTLIVLGTIPFNPVQNTFYAFCAVSVSSIFMTLFASPSDNNDLILPAVLRYSLPTGLTVSLVGLLLFAATEFFVMEGFIEYDGYSAERIASAVLIMFLSLSGALQLLVVRPCFKLFSLDGVVYKDYRPLALMCLLILIIFAGSNLEFVTMLMDVPILSPMTQAIVCAFAVGWLALQHIVIRIPKLNVAEKYVDEWYHRSLDRQWEKERNSQ